MNTYFFFDTACTEKLNNAQVLPGAMEKSALNPLFTEEFFADPPRKWEVRYDNGYPNVFWDAAAGIYRCYYTLFVHDADSESTPLAQRRHKNYKPLPGRITALCYAESKDGFHWIKPNLRLVEFNGDRSNNIIRLHAHGASVFLDAQETEKEKKYKMLLRDDNKPRRLAVCFSPDGLHWSDLIYWPEHGRSIEADSFNFAFRDESGLYHFYSRKWSRDIRVIAHSTSRDFIHWSEPDEVLRGNGLDDQIYAMPVFRDGGLFFGLCSIFHDGNRDEDWDCVDLELAYSGDGIHWTRVAPGHPFIPRGAGHYPDGAYDSGCIYASAPVFLTGEVRFYYMGGNGPHTNYRETGLCCVRMGPGRYAAVASVDGARESGLTTGKFLCDGSAVCLTADLGPHGSIEVYTLDACGELTQRKRWDNPSDEEVKITAETIWAPEERREAAFELRFREARLYALSGGIQRIPNHNI